jgi:heme oxygenase
MATSQDEQPVGLAGLLKSGTATSHQEAEKTRFIHEFVKGNVTQETYRKLLVSLYHVYKVMEELWDEHWEHPLLEPLYFPDELCRTAALLSDCLYFGIDPVSEPVSKATLAYVTELRRQAQASPELLLPHAYVRYLGDLSGGQVLKKAAIRGLGLPGNGKGTQFYDFPRIQDLKKFKRMYRARMDSLPLNQDQAAALVEAADAAFKLNIEIFLELEGQDPVKPTQSPAKASSGCKGCPFAHLANLPGFEMPADHPVLVDDKKTSRTGIAEQLLSQAACLRCPLSRFGRHAPKIASFVLPMALAAGGNAILSW